MFDKLRSRLINGRQKAKSATQTDYDEELSFLPSISSPLTMGLKQGSYDNNYSSITRIAERFAVTLPYAVDGSGKRLNTIPPGVKALYNPNKQMSSIRFFKALATLALVHPAVYILVWRKEGGRIIAGGPITPNNIGGFTFLEGVTVDIQADGRTFYRTYDREYTDKEVIAISLDINPYTILHGYSPTMAAKKWSTVDDYIVDYQAGHFRNGAVPSGMFIITAPTVEAYNDIVDFLQSHHRGAGNNNNVIYSHRPTNTTTGQAEKSQIEWIPFSQPNKDLALKDLFEQTEKVRDVTFGVPREVKGYLQNSNYASATTAEHIFDKYVVLPKLTQIWTDFTHELNRITGGLGWAISFDFDITALADEEKVKSENTKVQLDTLIEALDRGFSLDSAVTSLGLPEGFKKLNLAAVSEPPKPEVDDGLPNLADQAETATKRLAEKPLTKMADPNPLDIDPNLREVLTSQMQTQVNAAVIGEDYALTDAQIDELADSIMKVLASIMAITGGTQYDLGQSLILQSGITVGELPAYAPSAELQASYLRTLKDVAKSYGEETANSIRRVLEKGATEGWDNQQIADGLRDVMNTDEWRVQRLARSEVHRANGMASLDAMNQLSDETGVKFNKTWRVNPNTRNHCELCLAMNGKTFPLGKDFLTADDTNWISKESADGHPNCNCYMQFSVDASAQKSIKVTCPKCKRHLFESKGGSMEGVKCQGCKRKFNFKVKGLTVESEEVER